MWDALKNAWKIPDLRNRIKFTIFMLILFRLGTFVPVPRMDPAAVKQMVEKGALLGFFDIISGGAFKQFSVFAMSITPYINASIIVQLLTIVIPKWEELAKEGEAGRKVLAQYTRYGTVILGLIQATGLSIGFRSAMKPGILSNIVVILSLTAGTAFLMWLGEQITDKGIGNGISLLIFAGIVSRLPSSIFQVYSLLKVGTLNIIMLAIFLIFALAVIVAVIAVQEAERRVPVQYAKRVVGRKVYGGQSTHIPIKVNGAGVIPIIFAMSILMFPSTLAGFFPNNKIMVSIAQFLSPSGWLYALLYAVLIIFFTYFYTAITFNPVEVAENMKKYGGFIPGIRPGRPTAEYLNRIMTRITLVGSIFLAAIALMPYLITAITGVNISFGGTALLIVVGVALETMKAIEAQMLMRHYQGFLK
ncbi:MULTISPECIES: preprotein translocase subunit SecY [Tepidanaerobacter]|uniref:Protein translocase subunit SecY n=1 Tax=Tepidanaerobacter syntrophicus TaxID=224999 RepID=A0A0U9HK48_9FIRM|nr:MULTISPECIES: preprotein translocase subunit SecY [Tepidanaerobacter]GAQ24675.1 preprotein translocase subunit SecY [Tepidanaerobacter syntrophicus]GLI19056.1 protein translocase subunit SecY [Tepidanaerobacter syntrophicus]GLI51069.1 protein translocase subunit SecY [Tepidanaerobacter syntrophicus]HHV83410.1 preprotein translocase subunit SecY [Tepidanaerobacter syntrophicus]